MIDTATDPWGIDIERVEVTNWMKSPRFITESKNNKNMYANTILVIQFYCPPWPGEGRAVATELAESHGSWGWSHQGGEGKGDYLQLLNWFDDLFLVDLKVIAAEGEQKASRALKEASDIISESPAALQLRSTHKIEIVI